MPKTLTDEQWDILAAAASEHAAELLDRICDTCKGEDKHRTCREKQEDADAIRKVIQEVEKEG